MWSARCLAFFVAAGATGTSVAYPEGAPWGAANPDADENCSSCHFDYDALRKSNALSIEGLPDSPIPNKQYDLVVRFANSEATVTGFQLIATTGSEGAGTFRSSSKNVEYTGSAIRSTAAKKASGQVSWSLEWRAPPLIDQPILFYLAITEANDDGSPFGDKTHFRSFELDVDQ